MSVRKFTGRLRARYGAAVAFMLVSLAGGVAIQQSAEADAQNLRAAQVEACERGNTLRAQVSRNVQVLDSFLVEAEKARRAAGTGVDRQAADSYHELQGLLKKISIVDCRKAIPKP